MRTLGVIGLIKYVTQHFPALALTALFLPAYAAR